MKKFALIISILILTSIGAMAQEQIDSQTVIEKYDQVSKMESIAERRKFLTSQSEEMRAALWLKNIEKKTEGIDLSAEQIEIIEIIKEKFVTVEYAKSVKGTSEADAGDEFKQIMGKAMKLLGKDMMRDLFWLLGDSKTVKMN